MLGRTALLGATNSGPPPTPGFGTKYANPATITTGFSYSVAFSPSGDALVFENIAYKWSYGTGFGVKYADPSSGPLGRGVAFSPDGAAVALGRHVYQWSSSTGYGTKYADPSSLPSGTILRNCFSPSGDAILFGNDTAPFVNAYRWSASGYGVKYSNPTTLPSQAVFSAGFSPSGNVVAVSHFSSPIISAYQWSSQTGFGNKYLNPSSLPVGSSSESMSFSPAGDAIAVATDGAANCVFVYNWSDVTGFGTRYAPGFSQGSYAIAFSPSGRYVAYGAGFRPLVRVFAWSSSTGVGTSYSPSTDITQAVTAVTFSPPENVIACAHQGSPYVSAYKWTS